MGDHFPEIVNDQAKFNQILATSGETPVIVDFFATWCGPCVRIAPVFEKLSETYKGKGTFIKVDVDKGTEISSWAGITSMPTFKVYRNSSEV